MQSVFRLFRCTFRKSENIHLPSVEPLQPTILCMHACQGPSGGHFAQTCLLFRASHRHLWTLLEEGKSPLTFFGFNHSLSAAAGVQFPVSEALNLFWLQSLTQCCSRGSIPRVGNCWHTQCASYREQVAPSFCERFALFLDLLRFFSSFFHFFIFSPSLLSSLVSSFPAHTFPRHFEPSYSPFPSSHPEIWALQ